MNLLFIVGLGAMLLVAITLVIVGFRSPEARDPLQSRLAEFGSRDKPVTLQEIELAQPFSERVLMPIVRQVGQLSSRFTPQATLESTQHRLDLAGNPGNIGPTEFMAIRIAAAIGIGGLLFLAFMLAPEKNWPRNIALTIGFTALGYFFPEIWLSSKIGRRQDEIVKALPDCLDLLTICVEAGLGFDAAMGKVNEKWENQLALAFGRVLQEIRLGKLRREALRDMAERLGIAEMTSFVAAGIQSGAP